MAGKSVKNFGAALRQGLGGADQGIHARDMENGDVQVNRRHVAVARAGEEMKPRLTLLSAWYDCGWRYERWCCCLGDVCYVGSSPVAAYQAWRRMAA